MGSNESSDVRAESEQGTTAMRTRLGMWNRRRLAAGVLALALAVTLLPRPALAGYQLTAAQQAHITQATSTVGAALVNGGTSPQDADMAVRAIRASLTASYSRGLSEAEADKAAGPILNAYLKPQTANQPRELTDGEQSGLAAVKDELRQALGPKLLPPDAEAVAHTAVKTVQQIDAYDTGESKLKAVGEVVVPFLDLANLTDPESPWYGGPIVVKENAPPPAAASAAPPEDPSANVDPDAITATSDDGRVIVGKPEGDGSTSMTVIEEDLNAGQNNNSGNTKNRTGSDDGKKDKDKQPNNSGGGNSSNHSGGGHHK